MFQSAELLRIFCSVYWLSHHLPAHLWQKDVTMESWGSWAVHVSGNPVFHRMEVTELGRETENNLLYPHCSLECQKLFFIPGVNLERGRILQNHESINSPDPAVLHWPPEHPYLGQILLWSKFLRGITKCNCEPILFFLWRHFNLWLYTKNNWAVFY